MYMRTRSGREELAATGACEMFETAPNQPCKSLMCAQDCMRRSDHADRVIIDLRYKLNYMTLIFITLSGISTVNKVILSVFFHVMELIYIQVNLLDPAGEDSSTVFDFLN